VEDTQVQSGTDAAQEAEGEQTTAAPATPTRHSATAHQRAGGASYGYALLLVIAGALGAIASIALTLDYLNLLADPDYVPVCDINPIVGCGMFLGSAPASAFGFPNVIIGMVAFPIVVTIGVVLAASLRLPRWFWRGMVAGMAFGIGFVTWLQWQSFTVIGGLCPYCLVVWAVMIPLFVHTVARAVQNGALPGGAELSQFLIRYRWALTVLWYLLVVAGAMFALGDRLLLMF